ncbi:MAG: hypothetical protein WCQ50_19115 [Spirochaetota bacterium]
MFKIDDKTTWWSPKPGIVLDARDLVRLDVGRYRQGDDSYAYELTIHLTNSEVMNFLYVNLDSINDILSTIGLKWEDEDVA